MFRLLAVFCLCIGLLSSAYACDLDPSEGRDQVDTYVEAGRVCLETPPDGFRFDPLVEQAFIDRINAERESRGLSKLKRRSELRDAARFHSLDMIVNDYFQHASSEGRKAIDRIAAFDRTLLAQSTAENIAVFGEPECFDQNDRRVSCFEIPDFKLPTRAFVIDDLHEKLMQSDGHRANILAPGSTHIAVGVARTDAGFYVTQLFTNQVGELEAPFPTQLMPNEKIDVTVELEDWALGSLHVISEAGERTPLAGKHLRGLAVGSYTLIVTGQNQREERRGTRTYEVIERLDLNGPSFTLSAPKGS